MSITVSRYAYENGVNNLRIEGVKAATINENLNSQPTKCLNVEFYSTEDLKALQDELNKTFPENIRLAGKFKEPEEAGLYLTCTGLLLYRDTEGDWSIRAYYKRGAMHLPVASERIGRKRRGLRNRLAQDSQEAWRQSIPANSCECNPIYK